ncbi:MAG: alpha/beta fold hydrolase [Thermoanaerobaculia bacterium]
MHVIDAGSGVPVLWIHGFPLSSRIFLPQLVIHHAQHLVPDLPGFGQTAPAAGEGSLDAYAKFALDLLDEWEIDRAIVGGLSMGGYIALAIARIAPERLRGLMLIDTRELADSPEARKGRYETIEKVRAANSVRPVVDGMLPKMFGSSPSADLVEEVTDIMMSSSTDGVIAALQAMAGRADASSVLPKISVPTLIVVGEEDKITPPSDAERMAAAIPNAQLVKLPEAGHLSNMEQAEEFNAAVSKFLERVG